MAEIAELQSVVSYIGLGSNLGDRRAALLQAVASLKATPGIHVLNCSSFEETRAIGPVQPDYLNAVAAIKTTLRPLDLLDRLQEIENKLGRVRTEDWGPRTIDLDILYYGDVSMATPRLTLPHPQITNRPFVQRELQEVGFHG